MKIIIPGGSGHIGSYLARYYHDRGDEVVVFSRNPSPQAWTTVAWDAKSLGPWKEHLEDANLVLNLAGRSVDCRYTPENRRQIYDSRLHSTRVLGEAIARCAQAPKLWMNSSTATIYCHRYDAPNDEPTGILGGNEPGVPETWNFSIDVAKQWEAAFNQTDTPATRKVLLRMAMVMEPEPGSVFAVLRNLVRKGLGGRQGNGKQYMSWIHIDDLIRGIDWIVDHPELDGPINLASPNPVPNAEFMKTLRGVEGRSIGINAPAWLLEIACFFLRTESELILKSRRVVPTRMLESGFGFRYPTWEGATANLSERMQQANV